MFTMSSSVAVKVLASSRTCIGHVRKRRPAAGVRNLSSASKCQEQDSKPDVAAASFVAAATAAGALYSFINTREGSLFETKTNIFPVTASTARAEPRRFNIGRNEPRNVMLHRMRSAAGRGMNVKYNVDWNTVLGEGAYGAVHPARLASTGEKVSFDGTACCGIFKLFSVVSEIH